MRLTLLLVALFGAIVLSAAPASGPAPHTFAIGEKDFLLDGQPLQIRCGEIHFARVPREYWRHRLQMCRAMGLNAVCAYLFWNFHEREPGVFNWADQADAAAFCRMAQEEGLWVILRPGPYACAEWDGGGMPWWLLRSPAIQLRTLDPDYMRPAAAWLKEMGRVLAPLQVSQGGPILMVQAENEYGSYGQDANYMGAIRQALLDAHFDVPLFACNPPNDLRRGLRADLFQVVNFGKDPAPAFATLREVQPTGPLMCGEFYPGWFDTWGEPHHLGNTPQYLKDLGTMLSTGASFSIYMAHGGTTFGLWSGTDRPFKPDTSSYDYDAPISETGAVTEKFTATRALMQQHLAAGEMLPAPPAANPLVTVAPFLLTEHAAILDNLPAPIASAQPRNMEAYSQGQGCIVYRTTLPAGPAATLEAAAVADFAWVLLDGRQVGVMDRRTKQFKVSLPARTASARLDILVEAMGHINYGPEVHDRKGLHGPVKLVTAEHSTELADWQAYPLKLDAPMLAGLKWQQRSAASSAAFWRGSFSVEKPADTFLDLRTWGKGVVWVNGHCLGRFWAIGPPQTAYVPGPWLKAGRNEVVVLDLTGPRQPMLAGLDHPILSELHPELDFAAK